MMQDSVEDKKDLWLIYELCHGRTMNEHLFEVKGRFINGSRIYHVTHGPLYHSLRSNMTLLKDFLRRMCLALKTFARFGIVHADLKPDNIIIVFDTETERIQSLKIIDFGSSFLLNSRGGSI